MCEQADLVEESTDPVHVVDMSQAVCDACGWHTQPASPKAIVREWARLHRATCPLKSDTRKTVTTLPDEAWLKLGWKAPYGFHSTRLDQIRMRAEKNGGMLALLECRVNETGIDCGYCHNCGTKTGFAGARSCQECGSSDADE